MTGALDHLFPLLDALDGSLASFLPPWARLVAFGTISGIVTMGVYRLLSNQQAIKARKERMRVLQRQLRSAGDDFGETMRLSRQNVAVAFGLLGRVLGPALLSSLPVVVIVGWLAVHWTYAEPPAGTLVPLRFTPATAEIALEPAELVQFGRGGQQLSWPPPGVILSLRASAGTIWQGEGAALATTGEVSRPKWWNRLLGNPAGYLPPGGAIHKMSVSLPAREVLSFGPAWMRGWTFSYFLTVILASLGIKVGFKIA